MCNDAEVSDVFHKWAQINIKILEMGMESRKIGVKGVKKLKELRS